MRFATVSALLTAAAWASGASAQPAAAENAELRRQIETLTQRIEALESTTAEDRTPPGAAADRIALSGDLRYRYETIEDAALPGLNRHRIRARFRVEANPLENLAVGLTLATGADNPVSANQTLGDGFSRKDIGFDRAYFAWDVQPALTLTGGKMPNPWFRPGNHPLVFDGDLNPEGLALRYNGGRAFATAGGFIVAERGPEEDAIVYALQGGYRARVGAARLTVGGGFLNYTGTQGHLPPYSGLPRGNSVDGAGNLLHDYDIVELFVQAELEAGGRPLRLFVDYAENTEADRLETGYAVGARWRHASAPGSWDVSWAYENLEADAVVATFTGSDFAGGGTDGKGHVLRGTYVIHDRVRFTSSLFLNERGAATGNERDYDRLQLDIGFKF